MSLRQIRTYAGKSLVQKTCDRMYHRHGYDGTQQAIQRRSRKRLPDGPERFHTPIYPATLVDGMQFIHEGIQGYMKGGRVEAGGTDVYRPKIATMILAQIVFYLSGADGTGSIVEDVEWEVRFN